MLKFSHGQNCGNRFLSKSEGLQLARIRFEPKKKQGIGKHTYRFLLWRAAWPSLRRSRNSPLFARTDCMA
jgi:hypothetical protein